MNPLDFPDVPHRRFPVQGHILSAGGDLTPKDIEDFLRAKLKKTCVLYAKKTCA